MKALENLKIGQKSILSVEPLEVVIYKMADSDYTINLKEKTHYSMDDLLSLRVGTETRYKEAQKIAEKVINYIAETFCNYKVNIRKVDLSK